MRKIILILLAILVLVYASGAIFFTQTTFPQTYINGEDRSLQNIGNLLDANSKLDDIVIQGRNDKEIIISPESINLIREAKENETISQNPLLWPISFFNEAHYEIEYDLKYNGEELKSILQKSPIMISQEEPEDAKIEREENGEYVIIEEKLGDTISLEDLEQAIIDELAKGNTEILLEDGYYEGPEILSEDKALKEELQAKNELFRVKVVYDFVDREYEFTGEDLVNLYDVDENGEESLDYDKARELIANMAVETDTFQGSRQFVTHSGTEITVEGGIYGWLIDVDDTTEEFIEVVENRESTTLEPYYQVEAEYRGIDDIGDTYIEIELATQTMYVFLNGEMIQSGSIVSGQPNLGVPTPTGTFTLRNKETERYLKGISPETGRDYDSLVNWWFPFDWDDNGIHNSTWRTEFGGSIYTWNGSYGCVNVVDILAQTIYDYIPTGSAVIIY